MLQKNGFDDLHVSHQINNRSNENSLFVFPLNTYVQKWLLFIYFEKNVELIFVGVSFGAGPVL